MTSDSTTQPDPRLTLLQGTFEFEGRDSVVLDLSTEEARKQASATPLTLKEGANYRVRLTFRVSGELVSGVRYLSQTFRKGLRVQKDQQMLGSFGPQDRPHEVTVPRHGWEEVPSGLLSRGSYTAKGTFTDDDGVELGAWEWAFDIKSSW
ncbi:hypothetical protein DR950_01760 [Kitasatospora xanthocidica]|uniref:Rho GDP-dissociation inhibitor n=1 Tax=Kitasatospora xanthocidica TaxID=83382 RepID=A0A372ZM83_9ACTN|nr:hypothetical protein [Kitasatospora xanthocidica]RGD56684.1 hypothetical protein DR950_01760 [Kitasatospora xanthocidica]